MNIDAQTVINSIARLALQGESDTNRNQINALIDVYKSRTEGPEYGAQGPEYGVELINELEGIDLVKDNPDNEHIYDWEALEDSADAQAGRFSDYAVVETMKILKNEHLLRKNNEDPARIADLQKNRLRIAHQYGALGMHLVDCKMTVNIDSTLDRAESLATELEDYVMDDKDIEALVDVRVIRSAAGVADSVEFFFDGKRGDIVEGILDKVDALHELGGRLSIKSIDPIPSAIPGRKDDIDFVRIIDMKAEIAKKMEVDSSPGESR